MSMMGMLGKVAMGIMVAKTVGKAMGGSGGLGDMLGGLMGGSKGSTSTTQGGGMGDLLGNLLGDKSAASTNNSNGLGDLLSSALAGKTVDPTPTQEEQAKIIEHIGEVTPAEIEFVKAEMDAPLDLQGVINNAKGIEGEVYLSSLMTINLDSQEEARYLDQLAKGLNISQQASNDFHERMGAPKLYS